MKSELTPKQTRGIEALMKCSSIKAAAESIGVNKRTILNWLALPHFRAALKAAETAAIDQAVRRLSELSGTAIDTLDSAMRANTAPVGSKIRAADIALSQLLRLRELADLELRVQALEQGAKHGNA